MDEFVSFLIPPRKEILLYHYLVVTPSTLKWDETWDKLRSSSVTGGMPIVRFVRRLYLDYSVTLRTGVSSSKQIAECPYATKFSTRYIFWTRQKKKPGLSFSAWHSSAQFVVHQISLPSTPKTAEASSGLAIDEFVSIRGVRGKQQAISSLTLSDGKTNTK